MYLKLSYILLSVIMLIILFFLGNYAINKTFSDNIEKESSINYNSSFMAHLSLFDGGKWFFN